MTTRRSTPSAASRPAAAALRLVLVAASTGPLSVARAAAAEPPADAAAAAGDVEATQLFDKALARYDTHEYAQAIDLFRQVYERTHSPALLFNMAQAYRLEGDCARAADLYHDFIRRDPSSPDVLRARAKLAELEPCKKPPVRLPVAMAAAAPAPQSLLASPSGSTATDPSVASRGTAARTAGVVLAGVAVVLAGSGGYYAWRSRQDAAKVSGLFATGGPWDARTAEADREGRAAGDTAVTLLALAGVSAALALATYVYGWGQERGSRP
jgi:hypothetical protein